jgi:hypothetical protein
MLREQVNKTNQRASRNNTGKSNQLKKRLKTPKPTRALQRRKITTQRRRIVVPHPLPILLKSRRCLNPFQQQLLPR